MSAATEGWGGTGGLVFVTGPFSLGGLFDWFGLVLVGGGGGEEWEGLEVVGREGSGLEG